MNKLDVITKEQLPLLIEEYLKNNLNIDVTTESEGMQRVVVTVSVKLKEEEIASSRDYFRLPYDGPNDY